MKKRIFLLVSTLVLLTTGTLAQTNYPTVDVDASDEFANGFSDGVIRKNIPVTLTADRAQAGYVVRFT